MMFLFLFLFYTIDIKAQARSVTDQFPDSLAYEITDTVVQIEAPPPQFEAEEDEDESEEETEETEYFIRKEFTGSILDSIRVRRLPAEVKESLGKDKAFWYANENFKRNKPASRNEVSFLSGPIVQTILWLIIIGSFVVFLILYLRNSQVRLFRKSVMLDTEESSVDTGDIFTVNYEKEIDKATAAGNYRLAVRLLFLRLLKNLSAKNLIQYKQDNTNFDYLLQLRQGHYYNDFFRVTRNYEFTWYGQFEIDADKYGIIKSDFDQFENKLSR